MNPTIKDNDNVLVSGIFYLFQTVKVNDIVAFRYKQKILIKRIKKIERNKFFVYGDNKKDSLDSKQFGFIAKEDILGKVFYRF